MMNTFKAMAKLMTLGLVPLAMSACDSQPTVSFSRDVNPILEQHCHECHLAGGMGEVASGLNMTSYDDLMKGARFGPMIIAGDPEGSNLLVLIEGRADPSISMPHGRRDPVSSEDAQIIRSWIEQGAENN